MTHSVKDLKMAPVGEMKIEFAEEHMPVLLKIRERFSREKPLKGIKIAACLHVTKETAVLMRTLKAGGAEVSLCASNPLSTQDDVAAALAKEGFSVHAIRGVDNEEYYKHLNSVLDAGPNITLDDGCDLISTIHSKRKELLKNVFGGQEETTTGVIRLRAMARDNELKYPVIAVNDTPTKHMFDNYYGTGASTLDGIMRATNILLAGKTVVIAGYGDCGKGVALRAKGMGAKVVVTEVDGVEGLRAHMDGLAVMKMKDAARIGDIFITLTGCKDVITGEHFPLLKNGAIICNSGHFDVEIDVKGLRKMAKKRETVRANLEKYTFSDGKWLYLIGEGRLVNLAAAEGHSSEVMDLSFSDQALTSEYLAKNAKKLKPGVHEVPSEIDEWVAKLKLETLGAELDILTPDQKRYLESWQEGT
ncbi:MAG TPA: adenosylhomocysteinase [Candidatus Norongarragalinales archaeon]|nr:adenosylhomocysteinase [Candidatus Norongarragalinales archaeon]